MGLTASMATSSADSSSFADGASGSVAWANRTDGSVEDDDRRPPIVAGTIQTTYQALSTWRQLHARTADDRLTKYFPGQSFELGAPVSV